MNGRTWATLSVNHSVRKIEKLNAREWGVYCLVLGRLTNDDAVVTETIQIHETHLVYFV